VDIGAGEPQKRGAGQVTTRIFVTSIERLRGDIERR
jgi:hypothetical protein